MARDFQFSPAEGSEVYDILGRPAYNGKQQGAGSREQAALQCAAFFGHTVTRIPRFSCELLQVTDTPDTRIDLPGPHFSKRGIDSPSTEAVRDTETSQEVAMSANGVSKRISTVRPEAITNSTSNSSSSSPLPRSSTKKQKLPCLIECSCIL